jgi:hypothetical protein
MFRSRFLQDYLSADGVSDRIEMGLASFDITEAFEAQAGFLRSAFGCGIARIDQRDQAAT